MALENHSTLGKEKDLKIEITLITNPQITLEIGIDLITITTLWTMGIGQIKIGSSTCLAKTIPILTDKEIVDDFEIRKRSLN